MYKKEKQYFLWVTHSRETHSKLSQHHKNINVTRTNIHSSFRVYFICFFFSAHSLLASYNLFSSVLDTVIQPFGTLFIRFIYVIKVIIKKHFAFIKILWHGKFYGQSSNTKICIFPINFYIYLLLLYFFTCDLELHYIVMFKWFFCLFFLSFCILFFLRCQFTCVMWIVIKIYYYSNREVGINKFNLDEGINLLENERWLLNF